MFAAIAGKVAHVKTLLDRGADPQAVCGEGWSWNAMHFACREGHQDVLKLLLERCEQNPGELVPLYLNKHVEAGSDHGNLLHIAAQWGKYEIIRYLLSTQAIVDVDCRSELGRTALHYAVLQGCVSSVKVLLSNGADVNASEPKSGYTALHFAAKSGRQEIVKMLFDYDCNAAAVSQKGFSPHILAIRGGYKDVANCIKDYILEKGKQPVLIYREIPIFCIFNTPPYLNI